MAMPILRVYLLSLFYPSVAKCQVLIEKARGLVQAAADKEWRVIGFGGQTCSIVFVTDRPPAQLADHFRVLSGHEQFSYVLVQVSKLVSGALEPGVRTWWTGHRVQDE